MRNIKLVYALRSAAKKLKSGAKYEWGHVGRCNCGHLVQELCGIDDGEIYRYFGQELDEWSEHAIDYCSITGKPVEKLYDDLLALGFSRRDIQHLENLSDKRVTRILSEEIPFLERNNREHVVRYMETLASLLEGELLEEEKLAA